MFASVNASTPLWIRQYVHCHSSSRQVGTLASG